MKKHIEDGDKVFFERKNFHVVETSVRAPAAFEDKKFQYVENPVLNSFELEDSMVFVTALEALLGTLPMWVHTKYLIILV